MDCERFKTDGQRLLDGELTPGEQRDYEAHVQGCKVCESELRDMGRIVALTNEVKLRKPDEEFWTDYWSGVYRRMERGVGFFLLAAGMVVLTGFGIFKAVTSPDFWTVKGIAMAIVVLGLWILFLSVARERYHEHKQDPYKEVHQ